MQSKIKQRKIVGLQIGLASPEQVLKWSKGEVTKSETINYKSLKPERGGLFDEAIFGPVKNYECACGKYKKIKHRDIICEKCGVEVTESIVRRERMGHIDLAVPVAHIWMTKELPCPSKISLLLDISYKQVEEVVYFVNYIILDEGHYYKNHKDKKIFSFKNIVDLSSIKSQDNSRKKILKILKDCTEIVKKSLLEVNPDAEYKQDREYRNGMAYIAALKDSDLPFAKEEVFKYINKFTGIRFGIGAEAIRELLSKIDLEDEYEFVQNELKKYSSTLDQKAKKLLRRLEVIKWLKDSGNKPEWMVLTRIPVTPPDTRPIIQLEGGRFTTSDINNFYRKIIIRNERLKKVIELNSPSIILNNEKRMLQEAVDALFDNQSRKKPLLGKDKRPLKSLSNNLKGKQGLFRQNLLGKRVDYSGRSVIVIGPELKMYEVGIPALMILKLFKPFIVYELTRKRDDDGNEITPKAQNIKIAEQLIVAQDDIIWPIAEKVIKSRPVLLNRAPTLHRLGIQAFEPKLVDGKAIRLHPLVTTAFNADFDGDQMAVHVPLSKEAVAEARTLLLASWHILGPKDGKPIITPTQDMVLGNYYLTIEKKDQIGQGMIFGTVEQALKAFDNKKVHVHTIIGISTDAFANKEFKKQGILITTIGKLILNSSLPENFIYVNEPGNIVGPNENDIVEKGRDPRAYIENASETPSENGYLLKKAFNQASISTIIQNLYNKYDLKVVPETMDKIKTLGFKYSMISATSISAFDVPVYKEKEAYFEVADEEVRKWKDWANKGLVTEAERYHGVVKIWSEVRDRVANDIENLIKTDEYKHNSIVVMADSGARGNKSNFTQLAGMRGLMSRSFNYDQKRKTSLIKDIIEIPIKHSFIEGLTISEFFNSSYGARKAQTDTAMKTSKSGYMTRKLVDATQEVIINGDDCGTDEGLLIGAIKDYKENRVIESQSDRIEKRFAAKPIYDKDGTLIIGTDEYITPELAKIIEEKELGKVVIRSPLHCRNRHGICKKCFGVDLSTNKLIEDGTSIGVIAAQSIGEPGTQLTMRTFHTGGIAGSGNITQGFERLKQLFDCVPPKPWEKSLISQIGGYVHKIEESADGFTISIKNEIEDLAYTTSQPNPVLRVKEGDAVQPGSKLTDGSIDINELLKVAGIERVRMYILKEVQKVYRLQGINISDKYIEVIIKQLTDKVQILNPGDADFFIGEVINNNKLREVCQSLLAEDKKPPIAINKVFGLDNAPAKSGSFLSAASFQDTKKTLTDAAVKGQIDKLLGLKENVILGNIIPAGTGRKSVEELLGQAKIMYEMEY